MAEKKAAGKKAPVKKAAIKKHAATVPKKTVAEKPKITTKHAGLTVEVFDLKGKVAGTIALPQTIFGVTVNPQLIAQAVRVYRANQRSGTASTKTRGEVQGSTRKIYRQKGTGRARHGGVRAPIFVHGGIAHGPKPQDYSLRMPKKMRRLALFSALSAKVQSAEVKVLTGLEKIEPKTKVAAEMFQHLALDKKKRKVLVVLPEKLDNVTRAIRNLSGVTYAHAKQLTTYEVVNHKMVIFMQESLATLEQTFSKRAE